MTKQFRKIMGKNAILEVLKASPQRLIEVYTSQDESDFLVSELRKAKVPVKRKNKHELTRLVDSDSHQSFVAAIKERSQPNLEQFLSEDREKSLVVMLDTIGDPQNMGSILRACECFGVDLLVYSKNRGVDITPTVVKVSSGAAELVNVVKVSNLANVVDNFQKSGYQVLATDLGEGAQSVYHFQFSSKVVLIMGSEGEGVRHLLKKKSDHRIYIPMKGVLDSLNVSQATAVILSFISCQLRLE